MILPFAAIGRIMPAGLRILATQTGGTCRFVLSSGQDPERVIWGRNTDPLQDPVKDLLLPVLGGALERLDWGVEVHLCLLPGALEDPDVRLSEALGLLATVLPRDRVSGFETGGAFVTDPPHPLNWEQDPICRRVLVRAFGGQPHVVRFHPRPGEARSAQEIVSARQGLRRLARDGAVARLPAVTSTPGEGWM